ncbi:histidinol dehydrogenase [Fulvimarina sp. 2208YS6-2-32]|uniref:Histidinol dehydrogenase n=1 Tax=Fulvimarina uroteuthidis TaxID=3098149 RepID=A0ABU5I4S7_9HYPH|nr:histidinol dehydrogenase [Fulvimarina sp. 2208YS6-2-32]MDY8109938.1 histidinol dehydrogenase [Fulvimarina sp. 2208YS6-2-32]
MRPVPQRLNSADADFETRFRALLDGKRDASTDVSDRVREIIADVRARGDDALVALTKALDSLDVADAGALRVDPAVIARAWDEADPVTREALQTAHDRITSHHRRQVPKDDHYTDGIGVELGSRWTAVESVGLYVPGGTASYPSSVLMNAVPAKVAGVKRIVMVAPARQGILNPLVLAAAHLAGIDEIYTIGGAQAVAALAYGTTSIAPVVKIVGPGNAYVAEAKRQVFGRVGIDMIAGPSEILVIADADNDPAWIAADLLSQAEHDPSAQSILITESEAFADAVETEVERQLQSLPRVETARASWQDHGAVITVGSLEDEAPALTDRIAPEHLEIATEAPETISERISNAGAIFLGRHTPEVIGDYVGGSNHVLPTSRSARFSSGLSVLDFVKRTSILKLGPEQLKALAPAAMELARVESLDAHGRSVGIRVNLAEARER